MTMAMLSAFTIRQTVLGKGKIHALPSFLFPTNCNRRSYHEVSFKSHGDPSTVLGYRRFETQEDVRAPKIITDYNNTMVRVEMWNAPLNPADINTIYGRYPLPYSRHDPLIESIKRSQYGEGHIVGGSEGWGIVTHVAGENSFVKSGDIVAIGGSGLGTYRSALWTTASSVVPLERGQDLYNAQGRVGPSTIFQLGGTALQMIRSFIPPKPGEVLLQNAGNSGVGFMVSQLARYLHNMHVVSIVRRGKKTGAQWNQLVEHLTTNGKCAKVVAEEDLLSDRDALEEFKSYLKGMSITGKLPRLGLNAVGGDSASLILESLDGGGTMITYGGMSMQPVSISASQLIFRDVKVIGYWHSRFMAQSSFHKRKFNANVLVDAVLGAGVICPPAREFSFSETQDAIKFHQNQSGEGIRHKVVFRCQED